MGKESWRIGVNKVGGGQETGLERGLRGNDEGKRDRQRRWEDRRVGLGDELPQK